ncbi:Putative tartrate transporter [Paraburkholderia saeva]|uniref:Tartrate transporter n=2 Tax=Paraburkholderia saeva TaxID=2777537 RepID=A0A9N8WZQ0_9BURK|nr:Putative tartrate transporter [Paraburkholderia saeva]CAG4887018.1 Putative tartrate transporter [Paraburkholderia saeva]
MLFMATMIVVAIHADRTGERRWHTAIAALIGAAALTALPHASASMGLSFTLLCVAAAGIFSTLPLFWTIPTAYLSGSDGAAIAIATISSLGLLGGFISPATIGWLVTTTGTMTTGLHVFATLFALGAVLLLMITRVALR